MVSLLFFCKIQLDLIKCIQAGDFTTNKMLPYPSSLNVVSLYTSIPIQEAITNATNRITPQYSTSPNKIEQIFHSYTKQHVLLLQWLSFCQKEGLPMGSNISGILGILFMDRLETIALSSHFSISPYCTAQKYANITNALLTNPQRIMDTCFCQHIGLCCSLTIHCYVMHCYGKQNV